MRFVLAASCYCYFPTFYEVGLNIFPPPDRIWDCELHSVCNNLCLTMSMSLWCLKSQLQHQGDKSRVMGFMSGTTVSGGLDSFHQGQANTVTLLSYTVLVSFANWGMASEAVSFSSFPFFPLKLHPFQMASFSFSLFRSFSLALIYKAQFT